MTIIIIRTIIYTFTLQMVLRQDPMVIGLRQDSICLGYAPHVVTHVAKAALVVRRAHPSAHVVLGWCVQGTQADTTPITPWVRAMTDTCPHLAWVQARTHAPHPA
jgi:hypothetical protein